jgi:ABC-2 type transport system ATP-binding protein
VDEYLEFVDLTDRADDRFKGYSLDMKHATGIAAFSRHRSY